MSGIVIALSIFALLLIVLTLYAAKIPSEFSGTIQRKINAPVSRVWDYVSDIEGIPLRKKEIKRVEILKKESERILQWREYTDMGGHILFEKSEEPSRKLEKRMLESSFGMTGTWVYEIEGDDSHCVVSISESSQVTKPWLKLLLTITGRNANLKREMEIIENFSTLKK